MILLTLVRKSELIEATWDEVDFERATWTIPKQRMKGRNPHVVYLSNQALDIFIALHTCPTSLKANLDRYAALHAQTYGETTDTLTLIPHMLDAFMAGDRGFRRGKTLPVVRPSASN